MGLSNEKIKRKHLSGSSVCSVCGWRPPPPLRTNSSMLHIHHVVPRARKGTDHPWNLIELCPNHHAIAHRLWPLKRGKAWKGPRSQLDAINALKALDATYDEKPVDYKLPW